MNDRFTFHFEAEEVLFRRIGTHDIGRLFDRIMRNISEKTGCPRIVSSLLTDR